MKANDKWRAYYTKKGYHFKAIMQDKTDNKLAIIIPAYKAEFLERTLNSIANQSKQAFNLYVYDDCSPEPIPEVIKNFESHIPLNYVRFDENLGGISLVRHWNRCISLVNEPWVWLFSDDDLMESNCVEMFLRSIENKDAKSEVYRFNTVVIDGEDNFLKLNPIHPSVESCWQFLYFWLRGLRSCTLPDLIFSRQFLERIGGFIEFPLAWGTDVATLVAAGLSHGIVTVDHARVLFRYSGKNISSSRDLKLLRTKIKAYAYLMEWLKGFLCKNFPEDFEIPKTVYISLMRHSFLKHVECQHFFLRPSDIIWIADFLRRHWHDSYYISILLLLKINAKLLLLQARSIFK